MKREFINHAGIELRKYPGVKRVGATLTALRVGITEESFRDGVPATFEGETVEVYVIGEE